MKEKKPNKKLIEVSIPLDSINRSCTKEKHIMFFFFVFKTYFWVENKYF